MNYELPLVVTLYSTTFSLSFFPCTDKKLQDLDNFLCIWC